MRIEFSTEHETSEALAMIIDICERQIHTNERRVADLNDRLSREGGNLRLIDSQAGGVICDFKTPSPPDVAGQASVYGDAAAAAMCMRVAMANAAGGDVRVMHTHDETAVEGARGPEAAAKAFGGNPQSPPAATTATAADSSTANLNSAPAVVPPGSNSVAPGGVDASNPTIAGSSKIHDSKGTPWDIRIHSEARSKNNDGTWRYKRKLDEAVKTAVLAEIIGTRVPVVQSAAGAVPPPPPATPGAVPPPPPVSLPSGQSNVPLPPPNAGMPNAAKPGVVPPPPPVNPISAPLASPVGGNGATAPSSATVIASRSSMDFPTLVSALNKGLSEGKISQDSLQMACGDLGIPGPGALASPEYAHLIDALHAKLFPVG